MSLLFDGVPTLAIDLDGTIADEKYTDWPLIGRPLPNVQNTLHRLKNLGCELLIYSCRTNGLAMNDGNLKDQERRIKDYLETHNIPFDNVVLAPEGKPHADFYIDNKAIEYKNNWEDVGNRIEGWLGRERTSSTKVAAHPWKRFLHSLDGLKGFTKKDLMAQAALFGVSLGPSEILKVMNALGNVVSSEYRDVVGRVASKHYREANFVLPTNDSDEQEQEELEKDKDLNGVC